MKHLAIMLFVALMGCALATTARAQATTQDVTIIVEEINEISVSGNVSLTINTATAGSNPDNATNATTTYNITTNGSNKKITGALGSAYAAGISLAVNLTAPGSGTSQGSQTLSTTAADLVTGVANVASSGVTISYTASATAAAVPNDPAGETQTVTFTITAGS